MLLMKDFSSFLNQNISGFIFYNPEMEMFLHRFHFCSGSRALSVAFWFRFAVNKMEANSEFWLLCWIFEGKSSRQLTPNLPYLSLILRCLFDTVPPTSLTS